MGPLRHFKGTLRQFRAEFKQLANCECVAHPKDFVAQAPRLAKAIAKRDFVAHSKAYDPE